MDGREGERGRFCNVICPWCFCRYGCVEWSCGKVVNSCQSVSLDWRQCWHSNISHQSHRYQGMISDNIDTASNLLHQDHCDIRYQCTVLTEIKWFHVCGQSSWLTRCQAPHELQNMLLYKLHCRKKKSCTIFCGWLVMTGFISVVTSHRRTRWFVSTECDSSASLALERMTG